MEFGDESEHECRNVCIGCGVLGEGYTCVVCGLRECIVDLEGMRRQDLDRICRLEGLVAELRRELSVRPRAGNRLGGEVGQLDVSGEGRGPVEEVGYDSSSDSEVSPLRLVRNRPSEDGGQWRVVRKHEAREASPVLCENRVASVEVVSQGENRCVSQRDTEPISLTNRFSALREEVTGSDMTDGGGGGVRVTGSLNENRSGDGVRSVGVRNRSLTEVLVMGDSRVRYLDRKLNASRLNGLRVCLPGAGVRDLSDRYEELVSGCARDAVVITHVGVNDVKKVGACELRERYKRLIEKVKESRMKGVVTGVLPRMDVGVEWMSRAIGLNDYVRRMCEMEGVMFVDVWDRFVGMKEMYAMDGLHLSRRGVDVLWEEYDRVIRSLRAGN